MFDLYISRFSLQGLGWDGFQGHFPRWDTSEILFYLLKKLFRIKITNERKNRVGWAVIGFIVTACLVVIVSQNIVIVSYYRISIGVFRESEFRQSLPERSVRAVYASHPALFMNNIPLRYDFCRIDGTVHYPVTFNHQCILQPARWKKKIVTGGIIACESVSFSSIPLDDLPESRFRHIFCTLEHQVLTEMAHSKNVTTFVA